MNTVIRQAAIEDYDIINRLYLEDMADYINAYPDIFKKPRSNPISKRAFAGGLNPDKKSWGFYVAEVKGTVVGVIELSSDAIGPTPVRKKFPLASIDEIIVDPKFRNLGIGTKLLEKAEEWARLKKLPALGLTTYPFRPNASELYDKLGYLVLNSNMVKRL